MRELTLLMANACNRLLRTTFLLLCLFCCAQPLFSQQASIDFSTYLGGTKSDDVHHAAVDSDGATYLLAYSHSPDFPVTDGSTLNGSTDMVLVKYDSNNVMVYARYIGSNGYDFSVDMEIDGENIYILSREYGTTSDFLATDGSELKGDSDVIFSRVDAKTGEIEFATYIGGSNGEDGMSLEIENEAIYILATTYSDDFPITDGSTKYSEEGYVDIVLMKMDSSANIEYASYLGPYSEENFSNAYMEVVNDEVYISLPTDFDNYPVTDGSEFIPDATMVLSKIDANGQVVYAKYLFNELSAEETRYSMLLNDGKIFFLTIEDEGNIDQSFVTDGSIYDNTVLTSLYTVFNADDGQEIFGSYRNEKVTKQLAYDKSAWLIGGVDNETQFLIKFDEFQQEVYTITFPGNYVQEAHVDENGIYLLTHVYVAGLPTTDGSIFTGGSDLLLTVLDHDGQVKYLTYLGGIPNENPVKILVDGSEIFVIGNQNNSGNSQSYPVTDGSIYSGLRDIVFTKFDLCPDFPTPTIDTLSPSKQLVCKNGLINQIKGNTVVLSGDSLPTIFLAGIPKKQNDITANYQWQESATAVGPWANITGETHRNFTPQPIVADRYFRRLSLTNDCCGNDTISISSVDTVLVNAFTAPTVDAGGIFNTCPSVNVTLEATVLGGQRPYKYDWDMGATDVEDPIVAPTESTVFTLLVTDGNDCQQLSQAVVNTYSADAGPETASACAGDSVQIGGTPVAGLAGVTYAWSPSTELSCTDCAQPFANPTVPTTYELTLTIPVTGAGTCQTTDEIDVSPISAPTIADFAGPDITICRGDQGTIGTTSENIEIDFTNVAQSSAAAGFTGTVANLTDNDFATGARTNNQSTPWIIVDLGKIYSNVNQVDIAAIDAANLNGGFRRLEVSTDNISWQYVTAINTATNNSLATINFTNRDVRYVRIQKLSSAGVLDLSEIRVYQAFNYTWAPGNYLTNNHLGQTTFQPGSLSLPSPNPILYYLTAERGGCVFVDDMTASVIEARAGVDGCGPRTVGENDRTPNINETYEWVKISGSGNFVGPTDGITAEVTASVGTDTEYEIRVSANGTICTDRVIVPPTCGCVVDIAVAAPFSCPSLGLNESDGGVQLIAIGATSPSIDPSSFVYTWSVISGPAGGLSGYSGALVSLTDTIQRTYRVTFTSTQNTSFNCTRDIEVNYPAWSLPVFSADDVSVCANNPITIGEPAVTDYTYEWSNEDNLNQANISMPIATVNNTTDFVVTVTDTRSGCAIRDTVQVDVLTVSADAGEDFLICDNSTIMLGANVAQPNATYAWEPTNSNWQNGTDENDAQPEVLVAINQEFRLTVTSTIGNCLEYDTVMVNVGTPVGPFSLADITYCPSDGAVTIGTGVPAGLSSYTWSPASLLVDATVQSPQTLDPPPANQTSFTVKVQNSSGCETEGTQTITPNISSPNAGSNKVICLGEDTNVGSVDNPTGAGISYIWTGTASGDLSSTSSPNPTFTPSGIGVFTFTLTKDDNGCESTAEISITVNEFVLSAIAPITICQGTAIEIGTTPESGVQYLWQPSTNLSDSTIANPIVSNLTSTTIYTLSATGLNNCSASTDVLIGVNTVPAPTILLQDTIMCLGEESVTFNPVITPSGNYNYVWSPNDGSIENIYAEQAEVTIFGVGTTTYTLQVTNTDNGCSSAESVDLVVTSNCDWGDLPDISNNLATSDYQTIRKNNGPVHIITPNLFLGNYVDGESEGQPNFAALGDGEDEDGLTIFSKMDLHPGGSFRLPFSYTNNSGETAYLEGWIDWNGDGDFEDANEMILQTNDGNGSTPFPNFLEIMIPTDANADTFLGMRLRLSNQANMTPYGKVGSGEVEDYLIGLDCGLQICLPVEGMEVREE